MAIDFNKVISKIGGTISAPKVVSSIAPVSQFLVQLNSSLGSNLSPQTTQLLSNYKGLPLTNLRLILSVSETAGATAPSGFLPIENAIQKFQIIANDGTILTDFDGAYSDVSYWARLLTKGGIYTPSPTPSVGASSTGTYTWELSLPFGIKASDFPLKLNVVFNTLSSLTTGSTPLASANATLSLYGTYSPANVVRTILKSSYIPVSATGNIVLNTQYDAGKTYLLQAYSYGADSNINNITFSTDGSLQYQNVPLSEFINKENILYANSVSQGVGHINGFINLFTPQFTETPATQLAINFASLPYVVYTSNSNAIRSYWQELA